jgi:sugar-specific transcriptional regulator TrmB
MQNFHATIQVAEDTAFRKTVLDAIERVAYEQTNKVLAELVAGVLQQPEFKAAIYKAIEAAVKQAVREQVQVGPMFNEVVTAQANEVRETVRARFNDERVTSIITSTAEKMIKDRLKGAW